MKYILLAYGDERLLEVMPEREAIALARACRDSDEALRRSGYLLAAEALQSARTAITVRLQNGRVSVADGPLAEMMEQLREIFIIDARDLNEAIQVAAAMPQARGGPIEVRPALGLDLAPSNRR